MVDTKEKQNDEVAKIGAMDLGDVSGKLTGFGVRHQQCLILFLCLTTAYTMRSCMGVSLVAMTDLGDGARNLYINDTILIFNGTNGNSQMTNDSLEFGSTDGSSLINYQLSNNSKNPTQYHQDIRNINNDNQEFRSNGFLNAILFVPPYPTLNWTKKNQDLILSSFQWGYMILQIPAGQLAQRFGARYLLTGALTINCIVSFSIPWAAYYGGWIFTVICRVLQGLSQACIMPGMHTLFGKWAPLEERARLAGFVLGGQALGTVLGLPITGFVAASSLGWPGIFRFYGLLSGFVAVALWYVVADSPAQHTKISVAERHYIEEGLGQIGGNGKKRLLVPWMRILRSQGLWAIVIAHIGQTWGQLTLYSEVPSFMAHVMKVNIKANGLLTALPFLVMWITNFFFSWFTDMMIVKKYLNVSNARKLANSMGSVPAAVGLVVLAFVPKDIYVVETILVIICGFKISAHVGFQVNHIDISPNFAGTMMSISNFTSNLFASLAPIVAGIILTDIEDEYLWRKVFFVAAGLYFFTNLVYVIFGTAEQAEWNYAPDPGSRRDLENKGETEPMISKKTNDMETDAIKV